MPKKEMARGGKQSLASRTHIGQPVRVDPALGVECRSLPVSATCNGDGTDRCIKLRQCERGGMTATTHLFEPVEGHLVAPYRAGRRKAANAGHELRSIRVSLRLDGERAAQRHGNAIPIWLAR